MKKKMIALIAGALMALSAGNALAYFEDYELIRVVYNASTGNEMATDLGNVNTLLSTGGTFGGGANAFTTGTNLGATANANLRVAYIALDSFTGTSTNVWLSSSAATQANNAAQYTPFTGAATVTFPFGYGTVGTQSAQDTSANVNSYQGSFNATPGNFAAYLATISGEASLASIASASVSQNLFFWANGDVNGNGAKVATILTNSDGSTTIQSTTQTPIPAAVYLLGSGLLGLVGVRRKQK